MNGTGALCPSEEAALDAVQNGNGSDAAYGELAGLVLDVLRFSDLDTANVLVGRLVTPGNGTEADVGRSLAYAAALKDLILPEDLEVFATPVAASLEVADMAALGRRVGRAVRCGDTQALGLMRQEFDQLQATRGFYLGLAELVNLAQDAGPDTLEVSPEGLELLAAVDRAKPVLWWVLLELTGLADGVLRKLVEALQHFWLVEVMEQNGVDAVWISPWGCRVRDRSLRLLSGIYTGRAA